MPAIRTTAICHRGTRLAYVSPDIPDWVGLGGIVWVGVAVWLLIHFGLFAASGGAIVEATYYGLEYRPPAHTLTAADLQRILGGSPVRDSQGAIVIDPSSDLVQVVHIDSSGTARLAFQSTPEFPPKREAVVVLSSPQATYQSVITALEELPASTSGAELWLAKDR